MRIRTHLNLIDRSLSRLPFLSALAVTSVISSSALVSSSQAAEQASSPPAAGTTTVGKKKEILKGYLKDEIVGVRPQLGLIAFKDSADQDTSRFAVGFTVDMNVAKAVDSNINDFYIGPQTGILYSHLGDPKSDFFGGNPDVSRGEGGSNFVMIPLNIKAGYTFNDNFRLSAHAGGNVTYRSIGGSLRFADARETGKDLWTAFPNVGADVEFGIGKNVAVGFRPDWTITPGDDVFSGMLTVGFTIG